MVTFKQMVDDAEKRAIQSRYFENAMDPMSTLQHLFETAANKGLRRKAEYANVALCNVELKGQADSEGTIHDKIMDGDEEAVAAEIKEAMDS